jgi:CubicO group peptidase (beta-lactamase class C family)
LLGALSRKATLPADYAYSSVGMAILGLSLAKIANAELGLLLQQEVLTPLGLTNTGYQANAEILSTRHHITTPIGAPANTPDVAYGAGGLYSTATDLMHFLKNQLRQKRTLGWKQYQDEQFTAYYHGGDGNGHQAFMAFRPDNGVGVIILSNSSADDALQDIALHLIDPDRDLPAFEHSPYRRLSAAQLHTFAGRYAIVADPAGNTIELQPEDGRLMYHEKTSSGKTVRRSALYAVNEHTFELIGLPVQLVFKPDDAQAHAIMLVGEQQYRLTKLN